MADFGFGAEIGRDEDANRWALATADVVAGPADWAATPVVGQRAVTIAAGQGQAAQITMPGGVGAKSDPEVVQLPFSGAMTHQGKLICREIVWTGNGSDTDPLGGSSSFVALNAGDFSAYPTIMPNWRSLVSTDPATGFVRRPGERYLMPLWYAFVSQATNEVRLWDLRNLPDTLGWVPVAPEDSSWSTAGAFGYRGLSLRREGNQVFCSGAIRRSGGPISTGNFGATFPVWARPSAREYVDNKVFGQQPQEVTVQPSGKLQFDVSTTIPAGTLFTINASWLVG